MWRSVRACLLIFLVAPVLCDISRREALVVFTHVTEGHQDAGGMRPSLRFELYCFFLLLKLFGTVPLTDIIVTLWFYTFFVKFCSVPIKKKRMRMKPQNQYKLTSNHDGFVDGCKGDIQNKTFKAYKAFDSWCIQYKTSIFKMINSRFPTKV